jgi:prepilin-type processing-associated H-X9-DG protein
MKPKLTALFGCLALLLASTAHAAEAPLADRIPGDALIYLGWSGADHAPGYDGSHLKKVVDASDMGKLIDRVLPMALAKLGENDEQSAKIVRQVMDLAAPMWHHPTAFYFGGVELNGQPMPKLAILCDAGADAGAMTDQINALLDQAKQQANQGMPAVTAKHYDSLVVVAFGNEPAVDAMFAKPPADGLDKSPKFVEAMKQVNPDPTIAGYVDVEALIAAVDDGIGKMADAKTMERWTSTKKSLGLNEFKRMVLASGFDGADWTDEQFVSTTGTDGLAAMFEAKPLDPEILAVVPKSADRMGAFQFDLGALVTELRKTASDFDPQVAEQIDDTVAKINDQAGLDIQKDLLDHLGSQWVDYTDRAVGGGGMAGIVVVNKLKDPAEFDAGMTKLSEKLNGIIAEQMHEPNVHIEFKSEVVDGVTLHYFAIPLVTPCWAVKDGYLFMGLYPQVVSSAVAQLTEKAPSIATRPEFMAVMKRLGNKPAASMDFTDLPRTAPDSYGNILGWSRYLLGMSDVFGITTPAMTVPPLRKIMPELSPCGGVSWTDAAGWHYKAVSPFPGSTLFASAANYDLIGTEMMIMPAIMMPALMNAREAAARTKDMSNLHQIGIACIMYANDNQGMMPDDLGSTLKYIGNSPAVFLDPRSNTRVPENWAAMSDDDKAKWVTDHADYVYLGKGLKLSAIQRPDTTITMYDKTIRKGRLNAGFADGHCALVSPTDLPAN